MKKIIILGVGGTSIDILDTINDINEKSRVPQYECIGFLDDNPAIKNKSYFGVKVLGALADANKSADAYFINGIANPNAYWEKESIIKKTGIKPERFVTIIHPTASVSKLAKIRDGVIIFQNVTVTTNIQIGSHVMILPNTVINHDCVIDDYATITAGVCISGKVKIGKACYIGTNSTLKGEINIGDNSLIGMGSVVFSDIPKNSVYIGNPAKFLKKVS